MNLLLNNVILNGDSKKGLYQNGVTTTIPLEPRIWNPTHQSHLNRTFQEIRRTFQVDEDSLLVIWFVVRKIHLCVQWQQHEKNNVAFDTREYDTNRGLLQLV